MSRSFQSAQKASFRHAGHYNDASHMESKNINWHGIKLTVNITDEL